MNKPINQPSFNETDRPFILNPLQVLNYVGQPVDMRLTNGERICNVFLHYVNPTTNTADPDYGDLVYLRFRNNRFNSISGNTQNIDQIGAAGSIC
ncbi:hypothetical protein C6W22_01955 [Bacillus atrophaeus]|nr:hypothetical protein C6W22_01955 [Bacillus atrophaeus]